MLKQFFTKAIITNAIHNFPSDENKQFFNDIDYMTGWEMRKDTIRYSQNFSPPDVELHCLYGDGIDTVER